MHKAKGKTNYNSLSKNDRKIGPLMRHFEYLMELGDEVRATQVVIKLVEGMQARVNRDDDDDARYLPMSMGYHNCYKRYMAMTRSELKAWRSTTVRVRHKQAGGFC